MRMGKRLKIRLYRSIRYITIALGTVAGAYIMFLVVTVGTEGEAIMSAWQHGLIAGSVIAACMIVYDLATQAEKRSRRFFTKK